MRLKNDPVVEETTEVLATEAATGLSRNQKIGLVVLAFALTAGVAYGGYRLVKFIGARRAAKKAKPEVSEHEELDNSNPEPNA